MPEAQPDPTSDPRQPSPAAWLTTVFRRLAQASMSPEDPFRTPVLATVGVDGMPAARHVVLREVQAADARLTAWTDARSAKCADIAATGRAAWLFWDPLQRLQVRLSGRAEVIERGSRCEATWEAISTTRRREYLAIVAPGAILAAEDPDRAAAPAFAILDSWVDAADLLQLDRRGHRRARLSRVDSQWIGDWVEP
jgi:hypothetical protein